MTNNIMIVLGILLFLINPLLSYFLSLVHYIIKRKRSFGVIFMLFFNIGVISILKMPNSDQYRYYKFFEDIGILNEEGLKLFLMGKSDFLFYISIYLYNRFFEYQFWIFSITMGTFICLIYSMKNEEKILSKKIIILLFDPFNIKRWTLGIGLYILGDRSKKKSIYKLLGILTHISILIIPIIKCLSKFVPRKIISEKKIQNLLLLLLLLVFFKGIVGLLLKKFGVHEGYLIWKADPMFLLGNLTGKIFNIYISYIDYLIFFLIYLSPKKTELLEKKVEIIMVGILLVSISLNLVLARRLLQIILIFYIYNYFEKVQKNWIKKSILIILLSKYSLLFIANIRYEYKIGGYPNLSIPTKEDIKLNNLNESYKNIFK